MGRGSPSVAQLLLAMAAFLVAGGPVAYFMWHELSTLLYGRVAEVRWATLVGALAGFAVLLWALARFVHHVAGSDPEGQT